MKPSKSSKLKKAGAPTWRFRIMEEDQKHVEPTHREHLATGGAVEPLVREAIQNSLDVTLEGQPTRVAIRLGEANAAAAKPFFQELRPHLQAIAAALPDGVPKAEDRIRFLAIEDFNTTGLTGDPTARSELNPDGSKNHFFRFWHRVGPASEFKRRGSWGVGKVVFSNASQIRTFFGLTLRRDENSALLMGEAGLTIHPLGTETYDWYGYYANHVHASGRHCLLPVKGAVASRFAEVFSLSRTSPGLSIVVPYVRDEVTLDKLACAIIEQYFLPVLAGRLEVIVRERTRQIEVNHSTIEDVASRLAWPPKGPSSKNEILALLTLARWQLGLRNDDYILLAAVGENGSYALSKDQFLGDTLLRVSDDFSAGKRVAIRIPVQVRPKQRQSAEEEVRVVLERDELLRSSNVPHLRSGVHISKMRSQGPPSIRGLVVIGADADQEQGELDKLLQASEGPAHINWEQQGEGYDKAKLLYDDALNVIRFMRTLVRAVTDILTSPQGDRDTRTLSVFFPDYTLGGPTNGSIRGRKRGVGPDDPGVPPPPAIGVIEGIVQSLAPSTRGLRPVEAATVSLRQMDAPSAMGMTMTHTDGKFRFERLAAADYELGAKKEGLGEARKYITLVRDHGLRIELVLRPALGPKMFSRERLADGFAIQGNSAFPGTLRPLKVRLAYASWGGSKSFSPSDFSLNDAHMSISLDGLEETARDQIVAAPNVLQFKPSRPDFRVEVHGFDVNRALHVDARVIDDVVDEEADT